MRWIAFIACLLTVACGQSAAPKAQYPPEQPDRVRELVEWDPTADHLKPNPKPDPILIGCMNLEFDGSTTNRTPLPKAIRLTRREVEVNAPSVRTWYAVESLDPTLQDDEKWIWLPEEGTHATVLMGNGFVGWALKVGPAPGGFEGSAEWYSDGPPFRGEPAPVRLSRGLCQ